MADNGNDKSKADWIMSWAQEHGEAFTGADAASYLNVESYAVGSALRGLVSKGDLKVGEPRDGKRTYVVPPSGDFDLEALARPEFISNLKQELADRLAVITEQRNKLDDEIGRIRAAFNALK